MKHCIVSVKSNFGNWLVRVFSPATWLLLALVLFGIAPTVELCAQDVTPKQKQAIKKLTTSVDRAAKQYKAKKFKASAKYIDQANEQLSELGSTITPAMIEMIKPDYERLSKAHQLLSKTGQKLAPLVELPTPAQGGDEGEMVSFTKTVAPILVAKCGNCHVNRARGDFSAATFEALDKSTTLAYGLPDDARLIQVIESGEMPKGGLKVEPDELAILRKWMKQGAKFDGDNPRQGLAELGAAVTPRRAPERITAKTPTGKETVSFGLHVAPILIENCAQCHINDNPRGNFSMANFRSLLAGGDGGPPLKPGNSNASAIVKRLRGDGVDVMPPTGKLDDKDIDMIAKWIQEGSAFDGRDTQLSTQLVAATVKADSQTHQELAADREVLAGKTWKLVMDGVESIALPGDNFVVTGSTTESRLTDVSRLCEKLAPKIASSLRADSQKPLVKGNISVFVFEKRYDFSEFGQMVEQLEFPKAISGYWGFTTIDAYVTVLMTRNQTAEDIEVSLVHQIAAVHVASLAPDVPRWFADGMGLWTAKKLLGREESMKSLDAQAEVAMANMVNPDDFVTNEMPADKAALVSYLFIKKLRSESSSYSKLIKSLGKGKTFAKSFQTAYGGTPSQMLGQGKKGNGKRGTR